MKHRQMKMLHWWIYLFIFKSHLLAFLDKAEQGLYQRRLSGQVSEDNDSGDIEFAAAVAAAAFAIHSLEEAELEIQKKRREDLETSQNKIKSRKDDSSSAGRATRIFSNTEMKSAGKCYS